MFFSRKQSKSDDPFVIKEGKFKYGGVERPTRLNWTEESYISDFGNRETIGKNFNFKKLGLFAFVIGFFVFGLYVRTGWLQITKGEYYYQMAEGNRIRVQRIEPKRGVLYDRDLRPLVRNSANFMIYMIPADLPADAEERNSLIEQVIKEINPADPQKVREQLSKIKRGSMESFLPVFVADNIEYEKAMSLYLKTDNWPGVVLSNKTKREYNLYSISMSHLVGYTGKINEEELKEFGDGYLPIDYIGKTGIEYFWENELKGSSGKKQVEVDALGKEKKFISEKKGEDGKNLVLSIDLVMQKKLEDLLISSLAKLKLTKASAIIMDPRNGEILSMVSLPSYDNNMFARGIKNNEYKALLDQPDFPLINRAVSGEFPSGSTIKPVMAAAALEEGVINENTSFLSNGGIRIGQWFFPDWKAGGHGTTDVRKALAESVNTFFYYIGGGKDDFSGLGVDRIVKYEKMFGLGSQTGIDLTGEADGFLPSKEWKEETKDEAWYIGDTYHLSIGQGDLLVTPLQVALYTSVFANGGKLYRPHLVKNILSGSDKPLYGIAIEPIRENFIKPANIKIVSEGMRQTVTAGSARSLQSVPVPVAGKTGTAQWNTKKDPHAWFTGFAPYDNPEMVITILVEEGKEGSSVATPIAREFLEWYYKEYKKSDVSATSSDIKIAE